MSDIQFSNYIKEIEAQIDSLLETGKIFIPRDLEDNSMPSAFHASYESWYTTARRIIHGTIPERLEDFDSKYRPSKNRKDIRWSTYTISDALHFMECSEGLGRPDTSSTVTAVLLKSQTSILKAARQVLKSKAMDLRSEIEFSLLGDELACAKQLHQSHFYRAAGVIAGVCLERHMKNLCVNRSIKLRKTKPTISDFNDALKKDSAYDTPTWRLVSRLADIRNYCAHNKDRDPTPDEVDDLITGVKKICSEFN